MTLGGHTPAGSDPPGFGGRKGRSEGLPRHARIHRGTEIRWILRKGSRRRSSHLEVFLTPRASAGAEGEGPRFGTIVPRYGRTIVARNRLRRRLRELGRREVLPALRNSGKSTDFLVRARPQAYDADFPTLRRELLGLTEALCSES
jgi:ribonuclease P protein component